MQQLEDSHREIDNLKGEVAGTLHIGTSHHIGLHRLPPVLKRINQQYPDLVLDIHFMDSEVAHREVQSGKLELGIITIPQADKQELNTRVVWDDPLEFVIGKNHPLAQQIKNSGTRSVTVKDLAEYNAVLPARSTYTRQILESAFAKTGHHVSTNLSTNYLETIKMLVAVGLGWGILPRTMLSKELIVVEIPRLKLQRQLGVVWHPKRTLSNAAQVMMELLEER